MNRRSMLKKTASAATVAALPTLGTSLEAAASPLLKLKGNIKHSVSRWCYGSIPLDEFAQACKTIGIESIELTGPSEWPTLAKYGLTSALGQADKWPDGTGLTSFFNNPRNHDKLVDLYEKLIPEAKAAGVTNLICFSGNRNGLDDYQGILNCQKVLKRIMPTAEKNGVTLTMELLSSRHSHPDYQCDTVQWGSALCETVGSERFKLLYDIFHMQSMHGDHIRNIQRYGQYISHYHTGGMPNRTEIDDRQEIYYPAIIKALVATGYKGYIGQEFVPTPKDKAGMLESLKQGVLICDV
ncbi:hydroxypyruvate isomerase family protein [Siphonobacter sp.]|uniref:hydroxypyruvate isomerase family protein n=1 Tax=Siphonobacter sp. TaxID=1869184 RepID=UPI003B3A08A7